MRKKHRVAESPCVGATNLRRGQPGKSLSALPSYHPFPTSLFYFETKSNKLILLDSLATVLYDHLFFTAKLLHFLTTCSFLNLLHPGLHLNHLTCTVFSKAINNLLIDKSRGHFQSLSHLNTLTQLEISNNPLLETLSPLGSHGTVHYWCLSCHLVYSVFCLFVCLVPLL